ncbi:MAG TPA: hypothetical protein VJC03_07360, partial [bacterium]|nr:hypothetical protein [bacterium]
EIIKPEVKKLVEGKLLAQYKKGEFTDSGGSIAQVPVEIVEGGKPVPVSISQVKVKKVSGGNTTALAEVVINNMLVISEIEVKNVSGRTFLKFPEYVSQKGKVYPQIKFLDPGIQDKILKAVQSEQPDSNPVNKASFRISKFSKFQREGSKLKYFVAVIFNDKIEVECKVMEGRSGPFVTWPARAPEGGGKWINQISVANKQVSKAIEKEIMGRVKEEESSSGGEEEEPEE